MKDTKMQVGIYKIYDDSNFGDLLDSLEEKNYHIQNLAITCKGNFDLYLYYHEKPSKLKWKRFLEEIVDSSQEVLKDKSYTEGFVLLLKDANNDHCFAVTGGVGYHAIQEFMDTEFGLDIISRLIKKDEKILKATRENSVIGGILGEIKYFRSEYNLHENESFGKIYQEIKANLSKELIVEKFGFKEEDIKNDSFCIAKSSFKLNKSITFDEIINIVDGCEYIIQNEDPIIINSVIKLLKGKDKQLINDLEEELFIQLWNNYNSASNSFMFDLCHPNFEKYLTASYYQIRQNASRKNIFNDDTIYNLSNIETLFNLIKQSSLFDNTYNEFKKLINRLKIYSYDEEGNENTKMPLKRHIFGDIPFKKKKYFYINNTWYMIKDDFIQALNLACNNFIKENWYNDLKYSWNYNNGMDENGYNSIYIGEPSTVVLDKIMPENIEPCDILRYDDENLYLIHVKAKFGNTMRDLCSQIFISANKIISDINSNRTYVQQVYKRLKNSINSNDSYFKKIGEQTNNITEIEFLKLFDKKLVFVLAVLDTNPHNRTLKDVTPYGSNIAKFSLQDLVKSMRGIDADLKITQINNS